MYLYQSTYIEMTYESVAWKDMKLAFRYGGRASKSLVDSLSCCSILNALGLSRLSLGK